MKDLIIIIVVAVVILGAVSFFSNGEETNSGELTASVSLSLNDLLNAEKPQKCLFEDTGEFGTSSGTTYIDGGDMRGNFTSETTQGTFVSHMIISNGQMYIWENILGSGFMTTIDKISNAETADGKVIDVNKKLDYTCEDWSPDDSLFELPEGIEFINLPDVVSNTGELPTKETIGAENSTE